MPKKVCCFGEILLRFAPNYDWTNNNSMPVFVGGAELNAATALANWRTPEPAAESLPQPNSCLFPGLVAKFIQESFVVM